MILRVSGASEPISRSWRWQSSEDRQGQPRREGSALSPRPKGRAFPSEPLGQLWFCNLGGSNEYGRSCAPILSKDARCDALVHKCSTGPSGPRLDRSVIAPAMRNIRLSRSRQPFRDQRLAVHLNWPPFQADMRHEQGGLGISSCATMASVGRPPGTSRAGAGACTTPSAQARQAYLGRRVTSTRNWAGITSSRCAFAIGLGPMAARWLTLADPMKRPAAAGAVRALGLDDDLDAREMGGRRSAVDAAAFAARRFPRRVGGVLSGPVLGDLLRSLLERELQLIRVEPLGAPAEGRALEHGDDRPEPRDLLGEIVLLRPRGTQERLQRRRIVRQVLGLGRGGRVVHGPMEARRGRAVAPPRPP